MCECRVTGSQITSQSNKWSVMEKGGVPDKDIKLEMKQKVKSASFGKEGWREKGRHCTDFKIASGQFNMRRGTFVENIRSLKCGSWIMEFWDGVGRWNGEPGVVVVNSSQ